MSKSPSLRRIQADIRELSIDPSTQYHAAPLENDMFVWHFTIRGAPDTDFEGGIYHGKILLPAEYPFKPPNIMFTTPNGRFETNTKLCLSFSAYHPELWQPAWGIRLILEALISFLPTKGDGAIGALDWTSEERKRLARESANYVCPTCGNCKELLDRWSERAEEKKKRKKAIGGVETKSRFQKEIEQLHAMQAASEGGNKDSEKDNGKGGGDGNGNGDGDGDRQESHEKANAKNPSDVTADAKYVKNAKDKASEKEEEVKIEQKADNDTNTKSEEPSVENDSKKDAIVDNIENQGKSNGDKTSNTPNPEAKKAEEEVDKDNEDKDGDVETKIMGEKGVENLVMATEEGPLEEKNEEVEQQQQQQQGFTESPLLSDPVVHAGIVIFSVIVFLLFKKLQDIVDDLRELESQFQTS